MKNISCSLCRCNFGTFWVILLSFLALSLPVQSCRLNQNVLVQAASMNQRGQSETNRLNLPDREGADIPSSKSSIPLRKQKTAIDNGQMTEQIEGSLEIVVRDNFQEKQSRILYFLNTDKERIPLYLQVNEPPNLISGQRVLVEGQWLNYDQERKYLCQIIKPLEPKKKSAAKTEKQEEYSDTTGKQKVLILLVNPSDISTPGWGATTAEDMFFSDDHSPNAFYQEVSKGKIWLTGKALGWKTLQGSSDEYFPENTSKILDDSISLFDEEVNYNEYDRLAIMIAADFENDKYLLADSGSLGKWRIQTDDGAVDLSVIWMSMEFTNDFTASGYSRSISHEFGHNFGWHHAAGWLTPDDEECRYCKNISDIEDGDDICQGYMYGDAWDIMGFLYAPPFRGNVIELRGKR